MIWLSLDLVDPGRFCPPVRQLLLLLAPVERSGRPDALDLSEKSCGGK
jgi:hypothetical protein